MSLISLLPLMIVSSGSFLLIKLRAFFIFHPIRSIRLAFSGKNTGEALRSLLLALAGTLGVGNIVGVTVGIGIGGPGCVFWLVISAIFSSVLKYSEVALSASDGNGKGMLGVIRGAFGKHGAIFSCIYASLCLVLCLTMGSLLQADAIRASGEAVGSADTLVPLLVIFTAVITVGGGKWIKNAVAFIIPLATLLYTVLCFSVIIPNIYKLPSVILICVKLAFTTDGLRGGVIGFLLSKALREGFARGLLSNEAGAGTSSFSHTALSAAEAARAGIFGILEVVFDTVFLCSLTAATVLIGNADGEYGMGLLCRIFENSFGKSANYILLFSIIAFAVSTVLCWYYYGKICKEYLFGKRFSLLFFLLFFAAFTVGLTLEIPFIISLSDMTLFFLSAISLFAVIKSSDRVVTLSENMGLLKKKLK